MAGAFSRWLEEAGVLCHPTAACMILGVHFLLLLTWVHSSKQGSLVAGCGMNVGTCMVVHVEVRGCLLCLAKLGAYGCKLPDGKGSV